MDKHAEHDRVNDGGYRMDMDVPADFRRHLKSYTKKDNWIASASYFGTFAVFFLGLYAAIALAHAPLAAAPFIIITAFAGVRLYVLQHDCGHHSLFKGKLANDLAGYALSVVSLTPYRVMQFNHNQHHAYLGNLDHRETTEIYTMTLREWNEAGFWKRLHYRLYRNPFVLIPLGAIWVYFIAYRWPKNALAVGAGDVILHNLAVATFVFSIWWFGGWSGLCVYGIITLLAGMIGVFLVYLQHNFEETYWDQKPELDFRRATLQGSSCLDFGFLWDLGTGNIAYHDLHHYMPSIPSYRLRRCLKEMPPEFPHPTIGWAQAFRSFGLKLWDEDAQRLVPFPQRDRWSAVLSIRQV